MEPNPIRKFIKGMKGKNTCTHLLLFLVTWKNMYVCSAGLWNNSPPDKNIDCEQKCTYFIFCCRDLNTEQNIMCCQWQQVRWGRIGVLVDGQAGPCMSRCMGRCMWWWCGGGCKCLYRLSLVKTLYKIQVNNVFIYIPALCVHPLHHSTSVLELIFEMHSKWRHSPQWLNIRIRKTKA